MDRRLLGVVLAAVLGLSGCGPGEAELAGVVRQPIAEVGEVTLLDFAAGADGEPFAMRAQPSGLLLVAFGYLSCPDVCPMTMADLGVARRQMDPALAERVSVAMISVDPERDEGPEIDAYLGSFFDDGYAALLAPDPEALADAGERFRFRWEIEEHAPGERYDVAHTAGVAVVDDAGRVVRELPFGLGPDATVTTLEALLRRIDEGVL